MYVCMYVCMYVYGNKVMYVCVCRSMARRLMKALGEFIFRRYKFNDSAVQTQKTGFVRYNLNLPLWDGPV
jgi:hypothetical protein